MKWIDLNLHILLYSTYLLLSKAMKVFNGKVHLSLSPNLSGVYSAPFPSIAWFRKWKYFLLLFLLRILFSTLTRKNPLMIQILLILWVRAPGKFHNKDWCIEYFLFYILRPPPKNHQFWIVSKCCDFFLFSF